MNEVLLKEETTTKTPIVDVESLVVDFTSRNQLFSKQMIRAVNEVSFQLFRGEALAVVGESGSGKSTCARTLCKLNKHTGGVIRFDQREIEEFDQIDNGYIWIDNPDASQASELRFKIQTFQRFMKKMGNNWNNRECTN
ncbi:MAG: ATP-binding cassette domain-containing protein, partial [bacterium]